MTTLGVWQNQGTIISTAVGNSPLIPTVIYEGNAQILSGTVFKMWYSSVGAGHVGVNYAESSDGLTWTQYGSNPIIAGQGYAKIFKNAGTYYAYTSSSPGLPASINVYTATDGITFTLAKSNTLSVGSGGSWDSVVCVQLGVVDQIAGTWYGYYAGSNSSTTNGQNYPAGLATSTDLITWTKGGSNPVITTDGIQTNLDFHKIGGIYYGWTMVRLADIPGAALAFPTDFSRYKSSSVNGPWTYLGTPTMYRTLTTEGVGITNGQIGDPSLVSDGTNLWMFFSADQDGVGTGRIIEAAKAPSMTMAQLVATYEGIQNVPIPDGLNLQLVTTNTDNFTRADANPIGGNWSPLTTGQTAKISSNTVQSSVAGTDGSSWYNTFAGGNDHWSQITLGAVVNASFAGVSVRNGNAGVRTVYRMVLTGGTGSASAGFQIQKYVSGVFTAIFTSPSLTVNVGDTLTMTAIGNQMSCYWNSVLIYVFTDSAITTGFPGFEIDGVTATTNAKITGWSGGTFQAAPPIPSGGSAGSLMMMGCGT